MWDLAISDIAGIRTAEATVEDGLNVVQASNFSGKSSFIDAVQTVMGTSGMYGESHPLTEGADQGKVTLETGTETYEVRLDRSEMGTPKRRGEPMLTAETDRTCARLFAFLGENNPIRARVRNGEDLTELLQAPLDLDDIDEQIASLRKQRTTTERQLEDAEQAASNIPAVTEAVSTLEDEIAELEQRRDELVREAADEASSQSTAGDDLADAKGQLKTAEQQIERLESRIDRTEEELSTKREAAEDIEIPAEPDASTDVTEKEERITELELQIDLLEGLHRANQRVLEEGEVELVSTVERSLMADEISCWVCGETTTEADIRSRLESMQEKLQSLRAQRTTLQDEIAEIEAKKQRRKERRQRKASLEDAIGRLKAKLDELEGDHEQAISRKAELADEVATLEAAVADESESVNEELTDVKAALRTTRDELTEQRSRLADLQDRQDEAETLADELEQLETDIEALRARKSETQWELKEQFDRAMTDVIERFAPGFDGARLNVKTDQNNEITEFELLIARDGRETDITTLSEGEQELVGVIVALAGHRTFDVDQRVPLVLLDGISQLSADNLRLLTDYLADTADILVTTAYPEAGDFGGHQISPDGWEVVSDGEPTVV